MADRGNCLPGFTPASNAFVMPEMPAFRPQPMLNAPYPSSLAFWHNPHVLQPVADPSHPAFQALTAAMVPEQKKHKRTRSGCFTCRARRVKCDETRPICERCAKGKRNCVYPSSTEGKREAWSNRKIREKCPAIPESESEEDAKRHGGKKSTKDDGQETQARAHHSTRPRARSTVSRKRSSQSLVRTKARQGTETTSSIKEESSTSPSALLTPATTESQSPDSNLNFNSITSESPMQVFSDLPGAANLKPDVQFFLVYRRQHINHRHYLLRSAADKLLGEDMISLALEYEPLLYAMVGFAAYHYTLSQTNGRLYTFLRYYNKSVSLLLRSLQAGDHHSDAMLLTTLQLIVFEEFLGDWVNLIDHHQAAHRMILQLYSPEDSYTNPFRRSVVTWYARYDVMAGLMAGNATVLSREWYTALEGGCREDSRNHPDDVSKQVASWVACNRLFAMDMASFFAKVLHELLSPEAFATESQNLANSVEELGFRLDAMKDSRYLVTSFPHQRPLGSEDIVDPYVPGVIYGDPLFEVNQCMLDYFGGVLMYKYQFSLLLPNQDMSAELRDLAYNACRVLEAMWRLPTFPPESALLCHSIVGFVPLFLPSDEAHQMWMRRRVAKIEQLGYVYPPALRARLADRWKIPEVTHWWLPNDEGYPDIVREVREWTNERTTNPRDNLREAVRDMKLIFGRMKLDDTSSQESSPGAYSGTHDERTPD